MSDFLTSLVARSFGTAPVMRPRVTSLFEPVRGEAATLRSIFGAGNPDPVPVQDEEVISHEREDRKSSVVTTGYQGADFAGDDDVGRPVLADHSTQLPREPKRPLMSEARVEKKKTRTDRGDPKRSSVDDLIPTARPGNRESKVRPSKNQPISTVDTLPVRRPEKENNQPGLRIPPRLTPATIGVEKTLSLAELSSRLELSIPPAGDQNARKGEAGRLIPPKPPEELRMSDLALSARPQRRLQEEARSFTASAPPAEAHVHVTIGRIEVRASKDNPHSGRSTSASPVMSLDEYLRKRAQGVGQ